MKALMIAAALLLAACQKDKTVAVTYRADCEKCQVNANGQSITVYGTWTITAPANEGDVVSISACRLPSDVVSAGLDTLFITLPCGGQAVILPGTTMEVDTFNAPVSMWIWAGGATLAEESGSAWTCEECHEEVATVPED